MLHLKYLQGPKGGGNEKLERRVSGRYYTGESVGRALAAELAAEFHNKYPRARKIRVLDPFAGDGRLVEWLVLAWRELQFPKVKWIVELWDINAEDFDIIRARLKNLDLCQALLGSVTGNFVARDTFLAPAEFDSAFDIVITNPPWDVLKPDRRELLQLAPRSRSEYVQKIRQYDGVLAGRYPVAQPKRKFAGWGTNLSRVGLAASLGFAKAGGVLGIVLPASMLADDQSSALREHLVTSHRLISVTTYAAEEKLFGSADVAAISLVIESGAPPGDSFTLTHSFPSLGVARRSTVPLDQLALAAVDYVLPVAFGAKSIVLLQKLASQFPKWADLEKGQQLQMWAGREIDETGIDRMLVKGTGGRHPFVRGRMISRYAAVEQPVNALSVPGWAPPPSVKVSRIVWRDVSRPSQARRMIATIIPPNWIAGNSLGVAYFRGGSQSILRVFLAIVNSTVFEFQLRAYLATGHVSLSSLRKVAVPSITDMAVHPKLAKLVQRSLSGNANLEGTIDAYVAKLLYRLSAKEYEEILEHFKAFESADRSALLQQYHGCHP